MDIIYRQTVSSISTIIHPSRNIMQFSFRQLLSTWRCPRCIVPTTPRLTNKGQKSRARMAWTLRKFETTEKLWFDKSLRNAKHVTITPLKYAKLRVFATIEWESPYQIVCSSEESGRKTLNEPWKPMGLRCRLQWICFVFFSDGLNVWRTLGKSLLRVSDSAIRLETDVTANCSKRCEKHAFGLPRQISSTLSKEKVTEHYSRQNQPRWLSAV